MPLTRAAAERSVVSGLGSSVLAAAGMAVTTDGDAAPNADLDDPLRRAFDYFKLGAADPTRVTDADLAQVVPAEQVRFLLYLRIMAAETVRTHLALRPRSQQWEDYKVDYGELAKALETLLAGLWAEYRRSNAQLGAPAVGRLNPESTNSLDTSRYFPPFRRC